jgi:hypothetical protein
MLQMSQEELNEAVAAATGESVRTIRRRGFSVVTPLTVFDPNDDQAASSPYVDWDQADATRRFAA